MADPIARLAPGIINYVSKESIIYNCPRKIHDFIRNTLDNETPCAYVNHAQIALAIQKIHNSRGMIEAEKNLRIAAALSMIGYQYRRGDPISFKSQVARQPLFHEAQEILSRPVSWADI